MKRNLMILFLSVSLVGCSSPSPVATAEVPIEQSMTVDTVTAEQNEIETDYLNELSQYIGFGYDCIVETEGTTVNCTFSHIPSGSVKSVSIEAINPFGTDEYVQDNVRLMVIDAYNEILSDEVCTLAVKLNDPRFSVTAEMTVYADGAAVIGDTYNFDVSSVALPQACVQTIENIPGAMLQIYIDTDAQLQEYEEFANKLKELVLETYGDTFSFGIVRINHDATEGMHIQ